MNSEFNSGIIGNRSEYQKLFWGQVMVTAFTKGKGDGVAIPVTFHSSNHKPDPSFLQFIGNSGKGLVLKLPNRFLDSLTCTLQNTLTAPETPSEKHPGHSLSPWGQTKSEYRQSADLQHLPRRMRRSRLRLTDNDVWAAPLPRPGRTLSEVSISTGRRRPVFSHHPLPHLSSR